MKANKATETTRRTQRQANTAHASAAKAAGRRQGGPGGGNAAPAPREEAPRWAEGELLDGCEVFSGLDDYLRATENATSSGLPGEMPSLGPMREICADLADLQARRAADGRDFLSVLKTHPICIEAEARTGRSVEELLMGSRLLLGDPQYLDSWPVTCADGFVKAEDDSAVRLLLAWAWWMVTPPNQDGGTSRALDTVSESVARHLHDTELQGKRAAEVARRKAGGRKRAKRLKAQARRGSRPVVAEWRAYEKQGRGDRHLWAALIARKLDLPRRTVDRYLKQAGCRK